MSFSPFIEEIIEKYTFLESIKFFFLSGSIDFAYKFRSHSIVIYEIFREGFKPVKKPVKVRKGQRIKDKG